MNETFVLMIVLFDFIFIEYVGVEARTPVDQAACGTALLRGSPNHLTGPASGHRDIEGAGRRQSSCPSLGWVRPSARCSPAGIDGVDQFAVASLPIQSPGAELRGTLRRNSTRLSLTIERIVVPFAVPCSKSSTRSSKHGKQRARLPRSEVLHVALERVDRCLGSSPEAHACACW